MKFLKQFLLKLTSGREIEEQESKEQTAVLKLYPRIPTLKKKIRAREVQSNKD